MSQKLVITFIVVIVVLVGIVGYFTLVRESVITPTPTQPPTSVDNKEQGAGGSGLPDKPPTSKYCEDRKPPKEEIFGEILTISSDKKKIFLNNEVVVSIEDLPTTISVSPDSSFGVENKEFTSAILSPTKSIIAFAVSGGTHGWGGFKNVFSGMTYPVAFQFGGVVSSPKWNHDGGYIIFSKTTPKPSDILTLIKAGQLKSFTSEYEKVLTPEDLQPFPSGILTNLRNHYWSEDRDNKFYFLLAMKGTVEHAELWSVNADTLKWNFYCTSY